MKQGFLLPEKKEGNDTFGRAIYFSRTTTYPIKEVSGGENVLILSKVLRGNRIHLQGSKLEGEPKDDWDSWDVTKSKRKTVLDFVMVKDGNMVQPIYAIGYGDISGS